jgi:hypothetical protein
VEVGTPTSLALNDPTTLADVPEDSEKISDLFSDDEIEVLLKTPPEVVIGNHVFHLLELAALYLSADPPQLENARLTIDAVAGLLHAVGERVGEHGTLLNEALAQIQLAFVHVAKAQSTTE